LYSQLTIVRAIKSKRIRWAEHVASTGKIINTNFLLINLNRRDKLGDPHTN